MEFQLRLSEADALTGAFDVGGREIAVRAERAPVEATAVSGHWKGLITSMDAEIRLFFEVAADGTVTGRFQAHLQVATALQSELGNAAGDDVAALHGNQPR